MVDVRGDVLRPPLGTTPAAVKSNIKPEMRSFKSNENIQVCSRLALTYFTVRSNLVPCAFVWEKVKTMNFSENVVL